jgi:hypothetical protein
MELLTPMTAKSTGYQTARLRLFVGTNPTGSTVREVSQ